MDIRAPRRRMNLEDRQRQVLAAAMAAFAEGGYTGTTTDQVARRAGLSQPYVVRMFGSKQALFRAVYEHACSRIESSFREVAASSGDDPLRALGRAYVALMADRDLLRVLLHGFAAGTDPTLGAAIRAGFVRIYQVVRELTSAEPEQLRDFLARGMLINVLAAMELPEHIQDDPSAEELVTSALGAKDPGAQ